MSPDPDGEAKLDLSNTLKNFVTENLRDVNEIFEGPDTAFNFDLYLGRESKFVLEYDNIANTSGFVSFVVPSITATTDIPFQIGDYIYIEQDDYGWTYLDNAFVDGRLAFTGSTATPFEQDQQILITGQITNPQYNGYTTVYSANTNLLITNKSFALSSPVEPGVIYGNPVPEYDGTATITNIQIGVSGLTITVNKPYQVTTANPLTGLIRYADDIKTEEPVLTYLSGFTVYNARVPRLDYGITAFDPYVIQNRTLSSNYISTILDHSVNRKWRIERSTKSWLLAHTDRNDITGAKYDWYDSANTYLGWSIITGATNMEDFYVPIGFDQISNSVNRVDFCTWATVTGSVNSYSVEISSDSVERTNAVFFELNDDCSMYDIYHLMWKDKRGSWLSYPFIYLSREITEVERKTYYQREGNWDNNTFGYDSYGRGQKQYYNRSRDKFLLNSGWLNDWEVPLIKDLMESASVYIQQPDGTLIGCIIEENEFESKKSINDQMINYTLSVKLSSNEFRF
jgi:hypothetical protein